MTQPIMTAFAVDFEPVGRRGRCPDDASLLVCARQSGVGISSVCGGLGTCHSCKVQILRGAISQPTARELETLTLLESFGFQAKTLIEDGSKVGEAALPVLEQLVDKLAPGTHVEVTLIAVITLLRHWVVVGEASAPVSYTEEELKIIKNRVLDYLTKTGDSLKSRGIGVNTIVRTGNAAEEILKAADEVKADLIAMSTHGRSGLRRLAFGSITDKVLRGSKKPVLMVRAAEGTMNE